jgi:Kef-type K+ transport system membrane component KefB
MDVVRLDLVPTLLLDLAVIVCVAQILGALARRLGQPPVIGEIVGGIALGPTLFGGAITRTLFPAGVRPALAALAGVGVAVFMFLMGLELDHELLRGQRRIAITVSLGAIALPFTLGVLLALYLFSRYHTGSKAVFVLFLATAMSVTAFPVLARILTDKGLIHTPLGGLALACAALDDVLAWGLLTLVVALNGTGHDHWRTLLVLPYAAFMLWGVRPLLRRLAVRLRATTPLMRAVILILVAAGLLLSAGATGWMGLQTFSGAFLFGVVMPRPQTSGLFESAQRWTGRVCSFLLLPVFFMTAGLKVNLSTVDLAAAGQLALILLVAVGGKMGGTYLGARISGVRNRHSLVLATLMDTRGLTELIVLSVGLQLGLLNARLDSLMVVMAVFTTALTGILLRFVYRGQPSPDPHISLPVPT